MHFDAALDLFAMTQKDLGALLEPIPDARWAEQPAGIPNHPAWTLGHLSVGIGFGLLLLGRESMVPEAWNGPMGGGSSPAPDRAAYPDHDTLLGVFTQAHEAYADAVRSAGPDAMAAPLPDEAYRDYFPTVGHATAYFLMSHEPHHIGQLLAWRRAAGLAPASA